MMLEERRYAGVGVSPGIAIGRILPVSGGSDLLVEPEKVVLAPEQCEKEIGRFDEAVSATKLELDALKKQLGSQLSGGEGRIFDAHLMIVGDVAMRSDVVDFIRKNNTGASYAFFKVSEKYIKVLSGISDEYLRERAMDVRDVAGRILGRLEGLPANKLALLPDQRIIVAHDLTPSETAGLDRTRVLGFALEGGSRTSHTAILARSMGLPAVVGVEGEIFTGLKYDTRMILDGFSGTVIVNPSRRTEEAYRLKAQEAGRFFSDLEREKDLGSETLDGFAVQLAANIESLDDMAEVNKCGAAGVGLFRTEFLALGRGLTLPEEEQFNIYRSLLVANGNHPVVIRTLDIGGDKGLPEMTRNPEANPFLGLRGIRLSLRANQEAFRTQLRALLRAGSFGNLKIMIPMVCCVEEVLEVKSILADVEQELTEEKIDHTTRYAFGVMIETPAAALQADRIAQLVDFMSIGSNDLVQYTMSIDRGNEKVAYLYQPANPAVMELMNRTAKAAHKNNIWVGVCGQMAADPHYTALLMAMGIHELSMVTTAVGPIRRVIRNLRMHEAEALLAETLECSTAEEIWNLANQMLRKIAPEVAEMSSL
ncbi:MAG: phosphoenolpyruvate--protein phosphotransferase [Victivallaceae bacterium]|nr:phosphoenolpyruvate--protein phosphotransferase [Victivallaceae bacterium]